MKHYLVAFISILFLSIESNAQDKVTFNGYIKDSTNGETLIGATIYIKELRVGTQTNEYGYFTVNIPKGKYVVIVSYPGFTTTERIIYINSAKQITINLSVLGMVAQEVVISSERNDKNVKSAEMSKFVISGQKIKELPVVLGEADVLKAITLLPGIKSGGEASTGFYVRGGGPDQNLILMDEGVIYNASHLLGFLSVFNTDAVRNVEIIKGGMPAQYGGRLSSILNVSLKEGNNQRIQGSGGVGLISSRLALEGPIIKNKSSFMVSARRTYIDVVVKPFIADSLRSNGYYFYDINAKLNYILSEKDRIFISAYHGRDLFTFKSPQNRDVKFNINWGNTMIGFRWNHVFDNSIFSNLSVNYTRYDLGNRFEFGQNNFNIIFTANSGIRDWSVKYDLQHNISPKHKLKYGTNYVFHTFQPGIANGQAGGTSINNTIQNQYAHEAAVYIQDEWKVNNRLTLNIGLRYVAFNMIGPYTEKLFNESNIQTGTGQIWAKGESIIFYDGLEPRAAAIYLLNSSSSIKASYTRTNQFLHLATTSGASFPADLWIPSSRLVEPQKANQFAIGYFRNFKNNEYEMSVESYYKPMLNQIEFEPGTQLYLNQNLESTIISGTGLSYGVEVFAKKKLGNTTGWFGYTWSRTTRQFDELNYGQSFYYRYDRKHDISVVLTQVINRKWSANFVFVYGTGNATTLPTSRMPFRIGFDPTTGQPSFLFVDIYDKINAFRLPAYHRADISLTYLHKKTANWESSWNFAIYNVYNRANPYFIYFVPDIVAQEVKAYMVYLFPILPSITWNFKF
jgi:hypothetical protein